MRFLSRPRRTCFRAFGSLGLGYAAWVALGWLPLTPSAAHAQSHAVAGSMAATHPLVAQAAVSSGYLGVEVVDLDAKKAQILKLKETRGALITLIDHDAPACQAGLKVNDLILSIDGQNVADAAQLHGILRQFPPGRTIAIAFDREGSVQTLSARLADRRAMERGIWSRIGLEIGGLASAVPGMHRMGGGGSSAEPNHFHVPFFGGSPNVGATVEPLTAQMAAYLGVKGGVMVKAVAQKSEAAAAGLKPFDVIVKVGTDAVVTSADWARALRTNQGKSAAVAILRDKKPQTLTLQVDSGHRSAVEFDPPAANGGTPRMATLFSPSSRPGRSGPA